MSNLQQLQQDFVKSWQSSGEDLSFAARISGHLQAYIDSITASLLQNLVSRYSVCQRLVGEDFFAAMAQVYIKQTPSHAPDLAMYGADFPEFIAQFPPAQQLVYLADVARLEAACHYALVSADAKLLDQQALQLVTDADISRLSFSLPENSTLLASEYPIYQIWKVNQLEYTGDASVDLAEGGCQLIVWRQSLEVLIHEVPTSCWQLLQAVQRGLTLQEFCELAGPEFDLATVLPRCVQQGWLIDFVITKDN